MLTATDRINKVFLDQKITQRKFAFMIDISAVHLNNILKGRHHLTKNLALRIEKVFGVDADWFFEEIKNEK